ncbi:hypothetical protein [Lysobacter sp. Root494]|uniref:hypothetical protein n=1 Tax=Lysobacter sp. Root494 TaxID=1736549 RepID=UPI0012FA2F94|nr:hypothetical protein [Lysobacter sp. Root494]
MTDKNPYAAPTAAAPLTTAPPRVVMASVAIHAASFALGFGHTFVTKGLPDSAGRIFAWLVVFSIIYFYLRAIYLGSNWIRWLSIFLTALGIIALPWSLPTTGKAIYITQEIMVIVSCILLLLPSSARWYRPNNSFKPKPLRGSA